MPIYSLWLTNIATSVSCAPIKNANGTVSSWLINFNDLFRGDNYKYKKCRLRYKIISNSLSVSSTFSNSTAYIACSLSSSFNASNIIQPTALNLYVLGDCSVATTRLNTLETVDTAESPGINVNMPTQSGFFTITIGDNNNFAAVSAPINPVAYQIHIHFELYDLI